MKSAEARRQEINAIMASQREAFSESDERRLHELRNINLRILAGELDWEIMPTTPIDVACHLCHASAGEACKNWSKTSNFTFHDRRVTRHHIEANLKQADAQRSLAWNRR